MTRSSVHLISLTCIPLILTSCSPPPAVENTTAEKGDANAQYEVGMRHIEGEGVPQDYKKAFELLSKAAEQKHAKAENALGMMYSEGLGIPRDYKKAIEWYTRAAQQGNTAAQYNLGGMYHKEQGIPKDNPQGKIEAYVWMRLGMGDDPGRYRVFNHVAEGLSQKEEARAIELYIKRREEIRKRMAESSYDRESMGI